MFLDIFNLSEPAHSFHFSDLEQMVLAGGVGSRLFAACLLGGAIGMEREYHKKSLGLRTNLLICCGCAMFTFLSAILAGDSPDKGRVASNIVQGIGFLGAGLIMRNRFRVSGLTNAATVFVVAGIGMACGAGSMCRPWPPPSCLSRSLQSACWRPVSTSRCTRWFMKSAVRTAMPSRARSESARQPGKTAL